MEPFRRQVNAPIVPESRSFEYKLRVRGHEKGRKQRIAIGRCVRGGATSSPHDRGTCLEDFTNLIYNVGDIIVSRWRVTADR